MALRSAIHVLSSQVVNSAARVVVLELVLPPVPKGKRRVMFEGLPYDVEDDATYLARDMDGTVYSYTQKPEQRDTYWTAEGMSVARPVLPGGPWKRSVRRLTKQ